MNRYIITFGQTHAHRKNGYTFDKDSVAIIEAENYDNGRELAFEIFDNKFHQCVTEESFDQGNLIRYFPRGKHPANFSKDELMPSDMTEEEDK